MAHDLGGWAYAWLSSTVDCLSFSVKIEVKEILQIIGNCFLINWWLQKEPFLIGFNTLELSHHL